MTDIESLTTFREDAYRLLAACYYPPTKELLEENCCALLAVLLDQAIPDAAQCAREAEQTMGADLEPLMVEHARLFIGPFHLVAPPYGSLYLDDARTVMGESTARVAAFYQSCGLRLADDFHELPDHIAVELEFLSYLAHEEREAVVMDNRDEVDRLAGLQREFLATYLLPWLEPFTRAIIDDGESPFYQAVARCTAAFVNADNEALTAKEHA
ncbi:putative dimethyl sulfoxide reductase chaperone [Geobacter sp. OR-1]|uniref:TorD/DmsD family molecular chaperone n=1 Tax=Geobacter sp. OR-1 TaxID=1266765 RepID=UPI000542A95D|nr:molecular chaperone TorD family protein [Geobacter sp. OR-1]GAM09110.1 putative dimethyl sulfoxide reductase chaperone [Geobacter sp. OR-1]